MKNSSWRARLRTHRDFLLCLSLFFLLRAMMIPWFRPPYSESLRFHLPFLRLSDPKILHGSEGTFIRRGFYPFVDYWLEYPPVFPYFSLLVYRITEQLVTDPSNPRALDLFNHFPTIMSLFLLCFESANLVLLYLLAREVHNERWAVRTSWYYSALFITFFTLFSYFDSFVLFFILLSLWLYVRGKPGQSGIFLGVGAMAKLIPIALLPALLRYSRKISRASLITVGFFFASLIILSPFLYIRADLVRASFQSNFLRRPWETVWAIVDGYFGFGYVGPPEEMSKPEFFEPFPEPITSAILGLEYVRLKPDKYRIASRFTTDLSFIERPGRLFRIIYPLAGVLTLAVLVYILLKPRGAGSTLDVLRLCLSVLTLFFIYSKGWSPQFLIYLVPFVLLSFSELTGLVLVIILSLLNYLEMPIWLNLYIAGCQSAAPLLCFVVSARTVVLGWIIWTLLRRSASSS